MIGGKPNRRQQKLAVHCGLRPGPRKAPKTNTARACHSVGKAAYAQLGQGDAQVVVSFCAFFPCRMAEIDAHKRGFSGWTGHA